jgi:hypothetical protein
MPPDAHARQRLESFKCRAVDVADDGNCQFRAVSAELYGTEVGRW